MSRSRFTLADIASKPAHIQAQVAAALESPPRSPSGNIPTREALNDLGAPKMPAEPSKGRKSLKNGSGPLFIALCQAHGIHPPTAEYRVTPLRRWRFDWAWIEWRVALEVQGGIWTAGRHSRGAALLKEWEKLNAAAGLGWRILYCQPDDLLTTATMDTIKEALSFTK